MEELCKICGKTITKYHRCDRVRYCFTCDRKLDFFDIEHGLENDGHDVQILLRSNHDVMEILKIIKTRLFNDYGNFFGYQIITTFPLEEKERSLIFDFLREYYNCSEYDTDNIQFWREQEWEKMIQEWERVDVECIFEHKYDLRAVLEFMENKRKEKFEKDKNC